MSSDLIRVRRTCGATIQYNRIIHWWNCTMRTLGYPARRRHQSWIGILELDMWNRDHNGLAKVKMDVSSRSRTLQVCAGIRWAGWAPPSCGVGLAQQLMHTLIIVQWLTEFLPYHRSEVAYSTKIEFLPSPATLFSFPKGQNYENNNCPAWVLVFKRTK